MDEKKLGTEEVSEKPSVPAGPGLRRLMRILTSIVTVLMIALAVYLVVNRSRFNLDVLKRQLTYRSLERSEEGLAAAFSIGQEEEVCSATLSDGVILCSENRIQLYSDGGIQYEDVSTVMKAPVIHCIGNNAVVYDAGGNELYLFADRQMIFHYTSESGYGLISARVNPSGWLCVVEQASGYKGTVTVYNAAQEPVITERISSQFVMDAVLSPDSRLLGVLTISQNDTDFASTLSVYKVEDGTMSKSVLVGDTPILEMEWNSDGLWMQHQYGIIRLNNQYEIVGDWKNTGLHLQGYSLSGDGFAVEYFSRDRSGANGQLISIDNSGKVLGNMNISREILSVTAAGRYIAVLTSQQLTIYTSDFAEYASLKNTNGTQSALARADGTAMLIQGETAGVFLP